jgi:hypothetical protein
MEQGGTTHKIKGNTETRERRREAKRGTERDNRQIGKEVGVYMYVQTD